MSLRDKKFIRTVITKTSQPLVTVANGSFLFNSHFVRTAELKKYSRVTVYIDEEKYKIGFDFHNNEEERNSFTLQVREGNAHIKANEIIFNTPFIKKVMQLRNKIDRRFSVVFDRAEKLYIVYISPIFENEVFDKKEIPSGITGIYRYLDGDEVVYIGRGRIKSRLNEPERKDWKFNKIQYSVIEDDEKQIEWETYWIKRYKEDSGGKLPFYNKIEGQKQINASFN